MLSKDTTHHEEEIDETSKSVTINSKKLRGKFLDFAGWLMISIQSVPSLFIWGGLMTLPFLTYLGIMFFSFSGNEVPLISERGNFYFLEALDVFLFGGNRLPEKIASLIGLFIIIYSVLFLRIRKPEGLVTSGPYRYVRHPQYLGVIIFTINLTSRSFRETLGDVGWIGPDLTLIIWGGTLFAYFLLAHIEERYLTMKFSKDYEEYRQDVAFLFPFMKTNNKTAEIIISFIVVIILFFLTVYIAEYLRL